jgi:5-formyltetrahydrofolate cyclo-ligase
MSSPVVRLREGGCIERQDLLRSIHGSASMVQHSSSRPRKHVEPVSFRNRDFTAKSEARTAVWDALDDEGIARFPFPPHGRIPNFANAPAAADRLFETRLFQTARRIKVNPDATQRTVRIEALKRGIIVYVPTPRLRGGFKRLDPAEIPPEKHKPAASLSNMDDWAEPVDLDDLPQLDAIVTGSVAVTRSGRRCGKGEGYSDLEFAILRELGHDPVPVATTVHDRQVVGDLPTDTHDLPLSLIVTPGETIPVEDPPDPPRGIDWAAITGQDLDEMPVLKTLSDRA